MIPGCVWEWVGVLSLYPPPEKILSLDPPPQKKKKMIFFENCLTNPLDFHKSAVNFFDPPGPPPPRFLAELMYATGIALKLLSTKEIQVLALY
jgi:hypothetical protein